MADIQSASWSQTDASNNSASPNGFPENMAPSGVDDSMRAVMGAIKRWHDQAGPTLTSGGSANTQTLTYAVAPAAYVKGDVYMFIPGFANTGPMTLNVNSLGAKAVQIGNVGLSGGELRANVPALVAYDGTVFQLFGSNTTASLLGTGTNDNAAAGYLGEFVHSDVPLGSAVTLTTTATAYNVTSIALTAGDWDIEGNVAFTAAGTSATVWQAGINLTSATLPAISSGISAGSGPVVELTASAGLVGGQAVSTGKGRLSVSGSATVYLIAYMQFTGTSPAAYGFIAARRAR